MDKKKVFELAEKMGINKKALETQYKGDAKLAEKQVIDAAKFMGIIKGGKRAVQK